MLQDVALEKGSGWSLQDGWAEVHGHHFPWFVPELEEGLHQRARRLFRFFVFGLDRSQKPGLLHGPMDEPRWCQESSSCGGCTGKILAGSNRWMAVHQQLQCLQQGAWAAQHDRLLPEDRTQDDHHHCLQRWYWSVRLLWGHAYSHWEGWIQDSARRWLWLKRVHP